MFSRRARLLLGAYSQGWHLLGGWEVAPFMAKVLKVRTMDTKRRLMSTNTKTKTTTHDAILIYKIGTSIASAYMGLLKALNPEATIKL